MRIFFTDFHELRVSWENLIKDQNILPLMIILKILLTFSSEYAMIRLGESQCCSL